MFETDNDLIKFALNQWANIIETGEPAYSTNDVLEMKPALSEKRLMQLLRRLSADQKSLVNRLRTLSEKH